MPEQWTARQPEGLGPACSLGPRMAHDLHPVKGQPRTQGSLAHQEARS